MDCPLTAHQPSRSAYPSDSFHLTISISHILFIPLRLHISFTSFYLVLRKPDILLFGALNPQYRGSINQLKQLNTVDSHFEQFKGFTGHTVVSRSALTTGTTSKSSAGQSVRFACFSWVSLFFSPVIHLPPRVQKNCDN